MSQKKITLPMRLRDSLVQRGGFNRYVEMRLLTEPGMDHTRPYQVLEDEDTRQVHILQETGDDQETEAPQDHV